MVGLMCVLSASPFFCFYRPLYIKFADKKKTLQFIFINTSWSVKIYGVGIFFQIYQ